MNKGMYRRLALGNIRKNYRFFIPRILCETGLTACFYIVLTLTMDDRLKRVKGGDYVPVFMVIGTAVIALLSVILMLYVGSFLMRQRKKEFGLYTVLGMEKKNVNRVLLLESAVSSVSSVILGLGLGVLMYKLCSLLIVRLLKADIIPGFYYITPKTIVPAGIFFLLVDALAFMLNSREVRKTKTAELLTAAHTGEREPKVKRAVLITGVLTLAAGYYIAITTVDPLEAMLLFFAAVFLVIIGTYCLMTAGSIFVLKALKSNRRFYYKKGNMTAVSGLIFRMKQNAVGLASIAILATGVLVMTSTTFCLYSDMEDILHANYPHDYSVGACFYDENDTPHEVPAETLEKLIRESAERNGLTVDKITRETYLDVTFGYDGGVFTTDWLNGESLDGVVYCTFLTADRYEAMTGEKPDLSSREAAVCAFSGKQLGDSFTLGEDTFSVKTKLTSFPIRNSMVSVSSYGIVVADEDALRVIDDFQREGYGPSASEVTDLVGVDFTSESPIYENGAEFDAEVNKGIIELENHMMSSTIKVESIWYGRENLYGMYGALLFLGIILGIVCLFATVLIIYYKQISEGYEDRERFVIMQKVGMSKSEVRKTIRRQILMVFFLPLIVAGIHIVFACPMLARLLKVLMLESVRSFVKWILISYAAFAAVYALIYGMTAKTYYKIVS